MGISLIEASVLGSNIIRSNELNDMEKEELIEHIQQCIVRLEVLKSVEDSLDKDIFQKVSVSEVLEWLRKINDDIISDTIPISFYNKIIHNIQTLSIEELPTEKESYEKLIQKTSGNSVPSTHENNKALKKLSKAKEFVDSFHLYIGLGYVLKNTVIIGANGCGKTSLANVLTKTLDIKDGIVIPAQKLLIIPTYNSTPNYDSTFQKFDSYQKEVLDDKRTYNASKEDDIPFDLMRQYGSEYKNVLSALLAERSSIRNKYCNKVQKDIATDKKELESKLDIVFDIWNDLIPTRTIGCDDNNNLIITYDNTTYPAYLMSDGERIILYIIGRVLLAPQEALIIVDEPEIYLHRTIVEKLWNRLENKRNDCIFIYLTHDLEFAKNRIAHKYWIKSFTYPSKWEIKPIMENVIPEDLLLKILGSSKRILFCEGKKNSLDVQIFEYIFPDYTITPVSTCKDVINYTKAFNKIENTNTKAFGIIDRDFREESELRSLKNNNIYSYDVAEVENLFLLEDFIMGFCDYKHETCEIEKIKQQIIDKLGKDKEQQISFFVSNKINHYFTESHVSSGKTESEVKRQFDSFCKEIDIEGWYKERGETVESIIKDKDYSKAICVYNNKGLHSVIEKAIGINNYREKALDYMKNSNTVQYFKPLFPKELFES